MYLFCFYYFFIVIVLLMLFIMLSSPLLLLYLIFIDYIIFIFCLMLFVRTEKLNECKPMFRCINCLERLVSGWLMQVINWFPACIAFNLIFKDIYEEQQPIESMVVCKMICNKETGNSGYA